MKTIQSEWMKGLLAAECYVKQEGYDYTERWYIGYRINEDNVDFIDGVKDYLDNYKERNNV